ncbi:MAG: cytochrome c [Burkholderiaceae bacterium]
MASSIALSAWNPAVPAPTRWLTCLLTAGALLLISAPLHAQEVESSIARGGRLYDKWWKVTGAAEPSGAHPSYPAEGKYRAKGGTDWRCKECHGWDYMGKDGAYSKGSHFSGIKGLQGVAGGDPARVVAVLKDKTHALGGLMSEDDLRDLAIFVSKGQVQMAQYIDRGTKKVKVGDKARGEPIYNTICANCHGRDGTLNEDGKLLKPDEEPLGLVANDNPWETLHKIRNGQPAERMPALRAFDLQVALDILAHLQTLPAKLPEQKK